MKNEWKCLCGKKIQIDFQDEWEPKAIPAQSVENHSFHSFVDDGKSFYHK